MDKKNFHNSLASEETTTLFNQLRPKVEQKHKKWRPSHLESTVLKMHFETNQFPTDEEKESILTNLKANLSSQAKVSQLNRWFKNEREKTSRKIEKDQTKKVYRKFQEKEIDYLSQSFSEENYPTVNKMNTIAKDMDCSLSQIENWFKHNRRKLCKQGLLDLKTKKYFKKDELERLIDLFEKNPCPLQTQITQMAESLNCEKFQIKNWCSNRRKKFKLLKQKNELQILQNIPEALSHNPVSQLSLTGDSNDNMPFQYPQKLSQPFNMTAPDNNGSFSVSQNLMPDGFPHMQQKFTSQSPMNTFLYTPAKTSHDSNSRIYNDIRISPKVPQQYTQGFNEMPCISQQYFYPAQPSSFTRLQSSILASSAQQFSSTNNLAMNAFNQQNELLMQRQQIPPQYMAGNQVTYQGQNYGELLENYGRPDKRRMLGRGVPLNNMQYSLGYLMIYNPNR